MIRFVWNASIFSSFCFRYEYEEDFADSKMPLARSSDMHPSIGHHSSHHHLPSEPFFPDADWLSTDAPVSHQIDEFAQVGI